MIDLGRFIYEDEIDLWLHASDEERDLFFSMSKEDRKAITFNPEDSDKEI